MYLIDQSITYSAQRLFLKSDKMVEWYIGNYVIINTHIVMDRKTNAHYHNRIRLEKCLRTKLQ